MPPRRIFRPSFVALSALPPSPLNSVSRWMRSSRRLPSSSAGGPRRCFWPGTAQKGADARAQAVNLAGMATGRRRGALHALEGSLEDRRSRAHPFRQRRSSTAKASCDWSGVAATSRALASERPPPPCGGGSGGGSRRRLSLRAAQDQAERSALYGRRDPLPMPAPTIERLQERPSLDGLWRARAQTGRTKMQTALAKRPGLSN
jgi:hypothetical protein